MQNGGTHSDLEAGALEGLIYVTFPVAGVALATKRPRNPLGWLMLVIGAFFLSPGAAYARYASVTRGGELPGAGSPWRSTIRVGSCSSGCRASS